MKTKVDGVYVTILAALGLACAARPGGSDDGTEDTGDSTGTSSTESTMGDGDGDPTGDGDGDPTGDGDGDPTGDGDGDPTGDGDGDDPPPPPFECVNPVPIMQAGTDTPSGFVMCEGGFIHRPEAVECLAPQGPDSPNCADIMGTCLTGADCIEQPYGSCVDDVWLGGCNCHYGCLSDADCGEGEICACAGVIDGKSQCIPAGCTISDDCEPGLCGLSEYEGICDNSYEMACAGPQDECHVDADCSEDLCDPNWPEGGSVMYQCTANGGEGFHCSPPGWCNGDCGRPFFVEGEVRLAPTVGRDDWQVAATLEDVDAHTRRRLVDYWTTIGQFEHAAIASFARFCLHLQQLGAPPALLLDTQQALIDEIEHARVAFGLASAYAGAPVGPGPLNVEASLAGGVDVRAIVEGLVIEACVGETLSALEAREAAAHACDPSVAAALDQIAQDELRHAQLGWRSLRWILDGADAELLIFALARLEVAIQAIEAGAPVRGVPTRLRRHGVLDDALREEVRREGLAVLVRPCLDALREHFGLGEPAARSDYPTQMCVGSSGAQA